jgi:O-antigen ligase/Flp pilus assembly protein TadD
MKRGSGSRGPRRADQTDRDPAEISRSRVRRFGVAVVCVKVALLPVIFDYSLDAPFTVAKALFSHGFAYVLAGVIVGLFIRFGRSFFVWSPLHVPVLCFLVANIAAAALAVDWVLALYGAHGRMLGLGTVVDWVVLYFAVVLLVRTRAEAIAVIASMLSGSLVVLTYEFVQLLGKDPLSWSIDVMTRPISTIGQATSLANYLTILAMGSLSLAFVVPGLPRVVRVVLAGLAVLLLTGVGATGTRSAVVGIAAGGAVLVLSIWLRHPNRRARALGLAAAAAASAALAVLLLLSPLGARLAAVSPQPEDTDDDLLARLEPATETRAAIYEIAFAMVRDRPILGYGPDNFVVGVPRFRTDNEPPEIRQSLATSAHSWVAYVATSSGIIGLAAFVAVAAVALSLAFRPGFHPVAQVAAAALAAFLGTGLTTINDTSTDWLFWAAAGTIAAVAARPVVSISQTRSKSKSHGTRSMNGVGRGALPVAMLVCVALGIALSLTTVNAWEASRSNRSSQLSRIQGRAEAAIDRGLVATRLDPARANYWHGLGLAYISARRWADASAAFDRASRLAPYDARTIGDHARAQLLLAGSSEGAPRAKAIDLSEQAVRIDPNNPQAQLTRAIVMQVAGNLSEAVRSIERALELDPRSTNTRLWITATQIYLAAARSADAVRVSREGVAVLGPTRASLGIRYELARALVAQGQPRDALAELDVGLAIEPTNTTLQGLRAEIAAGLVN